MEVEFRDVPEFPGYQATNDGRVWSKQYSRFLKPCPQKNGYERVSPYLNGKKMYKYVHQMVASAFLGTRREGFCVDHINEIKSDNRIENLRYLVWGDNARVWHAGNKQKASIMNAIKMTPELVRELRELRKSGVKAKELAVKFGLNDRTVRGIVSGKYWSWVE